MSIFESGTRAAKVEANKAALDSVAKKKARIDFDAAGNVEGSVNVSKGRVSFTAYVKALVVGPQKSVTAGGRVEADF